MNMSKTFDPNLLNSIKKSLRKKFVAPSKENEPIIGGDDTPPKKVSITKVKNRYYVRETTGKRRFFGTFATYLEAQVFASKINGTELPETTLLEYRILLLERCVRKLANALSNTSTALSDTALEINSILEPLE